MDANHSYKPNAFFALSRNDDGCCFEQVDDERFANVDGARLNGRGVEVLGHYVDCKSLIDRMNKMTGDQKLGSSILIPEDPGHRIQKNFYRLLLEAWDLPEDQLLIKAIEMKRIDIALGLVRAGCYLGGTDGNGCTPLHLATLAKSPELVQELVRAGSLCQENQQKRTPIDYAVFNGFGQIVQVLVKSGYLSELRGEDLSKHLLKWFAWMLHPEKPAARWLYHRCEGIQFFVSILDCVGAEVLRANPDLLHKLAQTAIEYQVPEVAFHLTEMGLKLDHDRRQDAGQTLLHYLVGTVDLPRKEDINLIKAFLNQGASPNAQDDDLQTPLHYAVALPICYEGPGFTHLLINHGANVHVVDSNGNTPIKEAIAQENFAAAVALANYQALPDDLTPEDFTKIFEQAVQEDEVGVVGTLYQRLVPSRFNNVFIKKLLGRAFMEKAQEVAVFLAIELMALDPPPEDVEYIRKMAAEYHCPYLLELLEPSIKG